MDPSGLDFNSAMVFSQVYETPFAIDNLTHERVPVVFAHPLRPLGDDTWATKPRSNLRLSDGTEVTSVMLADALHDTLHEEGIEVDVRDGSIRLRAPGVSNLESRLTRRSCALSFRRGGHLLGTGPYRVLEASEALVVLAANEHARVHPHIPRVEVRFFPPDRGGKDALIEAMNRKEIDLTVDLARADVESVNGMRKVFRPGASTCFLAINTAGPLVDPAVRRAIAQVLDLHSLTEACYRNAVAYQARGLLPPLLGRTNPSHSFSPDEGRATLASLNIGRPMRLLRVWAPRSYNPEPRRTAELVAGQLEQAGLSVTHLQPKTAVEYQNHLDAGDYDLVLGGWIADTSETLDFYEATLSGASIPASGDSNPNACNIARWDNPEMQRLLDALRETGDMSIQRDIEALIAEQCPVIPLMYGPSIAVHDWRVQGFAWGQRPYPDFSDLELASPPGS